MVGYQLSGLPYENPIRWNSVEFCDQLDTPRAASQQHRLWLGSRLSVCNCIIRAGGPWPWQCRDLPRQSWGSPPPYNYQHLLWLPKLSWSDSHHFLGWEMWVLRMAVATVRPQPVSTERGDVDRSPNDWSFDTSYRLSSKFMCAHVFSSLFSTKMFSSIS